MDGRYSNKSGRHGFDAWLDEGKQILVTQLLTSLIGTVQPCKMLGFSSILENIIQGLRIVEVNLSNMYRRLLCVRVFLGEKSQVVW